MAFTRILTHPGSAHHDELLACAVLLARFPVPVFRREPTREDLDDRCTAVVDAGAEHDPELGNFDHHQFPKDHPPVCSLSLVLQYLGLYEDAREFCDWLETTEHFDTRGPVETARWLGVERATLAKLHSPSDITLLRRFAKSSQLHPGEPLWEILRWIGEDLIFYIENLRRRLNAISAVGEFWEIPTPHGPLHIFHIPRTDLMPDEPSAGIDRFLKLHPEGGKIAGLIYPDRRGKGYGLSRFHDHLGLDFTRISDEPDVHFAHSRGFVAKTSADAPGRLRELTAMAATGLPRRQP